MKLCLDAGLLMRAVEGNPDVRAAVVRLLRQADETLPWGIVASYLPTATPLPELMMRISRRTRFTDGTSVFAMH